MKISFALASLVLTAIVPASAAPVDVIYGDTFSNGSPSSLTSVSGAKPTIDTNNAQYSVGIGSNHSGTYQDNGSVATITAGNESWFTLPLQNSLGASILPSTTTGYLTLECKMSSTSSDTWAALGFTTASGSGSELYNTGQNWILAKSASVGAFVGGGTGGGLSTPENPSTAGSYFRIQLDLATNTVALYEGTSYSNMVQIATSTYSTSVSTYTGIELEAQGETGVQTWDDLALVYSTTSDIPDDVFTTPEPSSMLLSLGGLTGLAVLLRRRAKAAKAA